MGKYTIGGVGSTNTSTSVGSEGGNNVSFDGRGNSIGFDAEVCIGLNSNIIVGFDIKASTGDNLGQRAIYLGSQSGIIATGPTLSYFNTTVPTSFITGCDHLALVSFVSWAIRSPILFSRA